MIAIKTLLDSLASAVALLSLLPVLSFLDLPLRIVALGTIPLGWWCDRRGRQLLAPLPATLLAVLGIVWYALQVRRAEEIGVPLVNAMAVLLVVRLLTAKQGRDYLQIFVLALFILAGSSLLTLEIGFILYLVLLVVAVTVSLLLLTVFVTAPTLVLSRFELWRLLRVALLMPAASLVLMLGFFVVLPRTASPLWNFLNPAQQAVAGLAESVNPGAFAQLATTRTLAFRAEGPEIAPEDRYWRALVLNQPEESRWLRTEPPVESGLRVSGGSPVTLTIYPEPRSDRYLVTLDRPLHVSGARSQATFDQVFPLSRTPTKRFRYTVEAAAGGELHSGRGLDRAFYLTVPDRISPRVTAAAARVAASGPDSTARLEALAEFFRESQLSYAQDNLAGGADPVDDFLFGRRRGYCEFFASAYATLARLAGIPARLVGGYYGGDYNALGGYYLVTEDTAHVWVEVLTDTGVWQRVDPSQWAANAGETLRATRIAGLSHWQQLSDALNYQWLQLVVIFDLGRQLELLGEGRRWWREWSLKDLGRLGRGGAVFLLLAAAGAGSFWLLRRRRQSREARLLAALRTRVRRRYGPQAAAESMTLTEISEKVRSAACREFAGIYQGAVFRDRPLTEAEANRLQELLKEI
ncbi:MAG: DUF3488 domain-containing protein [Gemmatimonadales bacterium]|nr:MAG: DUF3488 domain-containing protein [Gemmatimonadales bacterium]